VDQWAAVQLRTDIQQNTLNQSETAPPKTPKKLPRVPADVSGIGPLLCQLCRSNIARRTTIAVKKIYGTTESALQYRYLRAGG